MLKQHEELLALATKLGFAPVKVNDEFTCAGKQALGACGVSGLMYTDEKSLVHEFVHVLQYSFGECLAYSFPEGDWVINSLPMYVEIDYKTLQAWVRDVLPALRSIYPSSRLPMELPALFAEAYYTNEDFLNGLIRLAKLKLGDS